MKPTLENLLLLAMLAVSIWMVILGTQRKLPPRTSAPLPTRQHQLVMVIHDDGHTNYVATLNEAIASVADGGGAHIISGIFLPEPRDQNPIGEISKRDPSKVTVGHWEIVITNAYFETPQRPTTNQTIVPHAFTTNQQLRGTLKIP